MEPLEGDLHSPMTILRPGDGPATKIARWQALLIIAPFAIGITLYLIYGRP